MRFSSWYEAADIAAQAPAAPGVFQVRNAQLLTYPSGRSAMVHYGASEADLRAELLRWVDALRRDDPEAAASLRYRHCAELGSAAPTDALAKLQARFVDRFGHAPRLPK